MQGSCLKPVLAKTSLSALPIPPPKQVMRFDAMPPTSPGPAFCPVCKEDLGSVAALGAHNNSFHTIRGNRLVTKPSFQCSQCELACQSKWRLRNHSCSSGDKLLTARPVGSTASTAKKRQPAQWLIATDGSASPSSVEQSASVGCGKNRSGQCRALGDSTCQTGA